MTAMVNVAEEWHGDVAVARIEGEIDASNVFDAGTGVRALMTNRSTALIVDLTATTYLDSAGINLLFTLGDELRGRQQALHLVVPATTPIARMLEITSLDRAYPIHGTLEAALASVV